MAGFVGTSSQHSLVLLPLASPEPATAPGGRVCAWTSKVTRLDRSYPGRAGDHRDHPGRTIVNR
jgi:hypothetical protein